jgi:ABC-type glycerol-3-phosphate transport system substrate-binding protein
MVRPRAEVALPELKTASSGHMTVARYDKRLYGVPLYADVSALFYNKDLFERAGLDPNKPPKSLAELRQYADKITALGDDIKGYYLPGSCAGCNIFTVGPLMWASGAKIEAFEPKVNEGEREIWLDPGVVNRPRVKLHRARLHGARRLELPHERRWRLRPGIRLLR